jgi:hypothetical protein
MRQKVNTFDANIAELLSDENHLIEGGIANLPDVETVEGDDEDEVGEPPPPDPFEELTPDAYDQYIGAEVMIPVAGEFKRGRVTKRVKDNEGNPIGKRHANPLCDSRRYEVEVGDGEVLEFAANVIAEGIYSQCDAEGRQFMLLKDILGHKKDGTALTKAQSEILSSNGQIRLKPTTRGWKLLVEWKDGSTSWVMLRDFKESYPVELAEYAKAHELLDEPAFAWWAPSVLKRKDKIISKVKSRYWSTTHKFGIRLPKSVDEALKIDAETGTDYWLKAIEKEMLNVKPAFETWDGSVQEARDGKKLVGYQEIRCHMVFDVKMDLTRKARFVAGGHTTETPESVTYSSVVSRESVRLAFLIAALNDLDVLCCDIGNAYLNADCREKIWTVAGREFGSDEGRVMIIRKALYGLKSSGAAWRAHMANTLRELGFKSTLADPDVWIRPQTRPNGTKYYEMVLVYVDDILHLSHQPKVVMEAIGKVYRIKEGSLGPPTRYLGADISKYQMQDGYECWSMSARSYVKNAVKNLEETLEQEGESLSDYASKKQTERPYPVNYRPEVDVSPLLGDEMVSRYLNLIGVLRWACELGRVDILFEVSVMSSYSAMPRRGHLIHLYKIFAYLKQHENSRIVFDDCIPEIDQKRFITHDWTDFYGDVEEQIPSNAPEPLGHSVKIFCYCDADHASNVVTRRSHTGILIYVNNAPIVWYSKRQNTVESSTFGSEFVAMRVAVDLIEGLRYKLRMFGVPIDGPADVFSDNQSVVTNSTIPTSTLNKKHNSICYHRVRESVAAKWIRIAKEDTHTNLSDLFTKTLDTPQRRVLLQSITH